MAVGRKLGSIWSLIALIAILAAVLWGAFVRHYAPIQTPEIAWWVLALSVVLTERFPVELEFRRSSHSLSLTDIPIAFALVFASGAHAFLAIVGGTLVAFAMRRMPPVKLCFNVAQFALSTLVAIIVVHAGARLDDGFGWLTWGALLLASQLASVLTAAQILAAIYLAEGQVYRDQVRHLLSIYPVAAITGTAMALSCSILWIERPEAAPLLLVPTLVAFLGYRTYVRTRRDHEQIKSLYEGNGTQVAEALEGLLEPALEAFRAQQAEVILFDGAAVLRTSLGPGGVREAMTPVEPAVANALRGIAGAGPVALVSPFPAAVGAYLAERGVRHCLLGVLEGEDRVLGTIMVANRHATARSFTESDRALFGTLAANASAALQYDRLEQAVGELRELQDDLQRRAHHDPLTGLANRALFAQRLSEARGEVAVLFIDLDDFKGVNDTLGHAVGDELLCGVASRLVGAVRKQDVVARLGGDEFAVLVQREAAVETAAAELAARLLEAFLEPVAAGGHEIGASLSIGVAAGDAGTLLDAADVAMYEAKRSGKRRFAVFTPALRRDALRAELARALEQACTPGREVYVKLSAAELELPELASIVADTLRRTGLPPQQLMLEVIAKAAERTLRPLRELGVRLALEFGIGSSLSLLRDLPLDALKLAPDVDAAFVPHVVALANAVGLQVIAPGVESGARSRGRVRDAAPA